MIFGNFGTLKSAAFDMALTCTTAPAIQCRKPRTRGPAPVTLKINGQVLPHGLTKALFAYKFKNVEYYAPRAKIPRILKDSVCNFQYFVILTPGSQ